MHHEEAKKEKKKRSIYNSMALANILASFLFFSSTGPQVHDFFKTSIFSDFIYLFWLCWVCCADFSLAVTSSGYSLVVVFGLLIAVSSLVAGHGLEAHRLQ